MFSNFDKVFKNNILKTKIPKEVLNSISEELPPGFRYIDIGNGACGISTDNMRIQIPIKLSEIVAKFKYQIKTSNDLLKYLYNIQKPLRIRPDNQDNIIINGNTISVKNLIKYPLDNKEMKKIVEWEIIPPQFPKSFHVEFEAGSIKKIMLIERKPYDSVNLILFESDVNKCLQIVYIVDTKNKSASITVNTCLKNAKSVEEVIETFEFYNNFCDGNIKMFGENVGEISDNLAEKIPKKSITFWKKVNDIEKKLNISFDPSSGPLTKEDVYFLEQIYRSIILKKPFREPIEIESVKLGESKFKKNIDELIGKDLCFNFLREYLFDILGAKFKLNALEFFYDAKIINYDIKEDSTILYFNPAYRKNMFHVVQFFETRKDAENKKNEKDIITKFKEAKEITLE